MKVGHRSLASKQVKMELILDILVILSCWNVCQSQQLSMNMDLPGLKSETVSPPPQASREGEQVMSVVLGNSGAEDYVQIINPPSEVRHGSKVTVEYRCRDPHVVGIQLYVTSYSGQGVVVWHRWWRCGVDILYTSTMELTVRLQNRLAYRPSHFNPYSIPVRSSQLWVWVVDDPVLDNMKLDIYPLAVTKAQYTVHLVEPYSRIGKPTTKCLSWWLQLQMGRTYTPTCPQEPEVVPLISYPVAFSGSWHGVHKQLRPFKNPTLERQRRAKFEQPQFTISVWLYVLEYCTNQRALCSIIQRLTWTERYTSPLVYINNKGQLHLQAVNGDGATKAFITHDSFTIPRHEWCHLVVGVNANSWRLELQCLEEPHKRLKTAYVTFPWDVYFDANMSLTIVGGSEVVPAFKGYVGEATMYRTKLYLLHQLPSKSFYDPMYEFGLGEWNRRCGLYLDWIHHVEQRARDLRADILHRRNCRSVVYGMFQGAEKPSDTCQSYSAPIPYYYKTAYKILRSFVLRGQAYTLEDIGTGLLKNVTQAVEDQGLLGTQSSLTLLRQASCSGNHDATFLIATLLNNGMGVKVDEKQAQKYMMYGAVEGNVLCNLALGNKHMYGLDGVPQDYDVAYSYYKPVAIQTRDDREKHHADGVYTEHVRLTDEEQIEAMTDEEGDVFHWLKHQSQQGVVSAQTESSGVAKLLPMLVEYSRISLFWMKMCCVMLQPHLPHSIQYNLFTNLVQKFG